MIPAIEFQGIAAGYKDVQVLHDIDLAIGEGEMVAVLGPNGAGKTTLFRVLTGLHPPLAGRVRIFGREVARIRAAERARLVGVVPQSVETPVAFSVAEMVRMGRTAVRPRWGRASVADQQIVERAMAYTDIASLKDRPFPGLSGGERQRAVIAMALVREPRILLLDEATSHLDLNHRFEVLRLAERLNTDQGVTVVMISHDLSLAADFCRRLILLDRGRIAADGTPAAVLTDDLLRRVYQCDIRVQRDSQTGAFTIAPGRRQATSQAGRGIRVHLVCGGGSGEELLRRLILLGYTVSCGVLNQGDSDTLTAAALGVGAAVERPYSPIGPEALQRAMELARSADAIILAAVPFGPGNLANLELLEAILALGRPVLVVEGIEQRDYTPGHQAVARVRSLLARGAVACRSAAELVARLPVSAAPQVPPPPK
jgi:iron complex transport system ATP-binding protein